MKKCELLEEHLLLLLTMSLTLYSLQQLFVSYVFVTGSGRDAVAVFLPNVQ